MTQTDTRAAIVDAITHLAEYFHLEMPTHEMRIYVEALADVPLEHLSAGCRATIQSRRFFPKVAELRTDIDAALERQQVQATAHRLLAAAPKASSWVCPDCDNTSWMRVKDDRSIPVVRRCPCLGSNPALVAQRKYGESSGHGGGAR